MKLQPTPSANDGAPRQLTTRIWELRKLSGLTLKDLADAMGTTPQTVQRLETGSMTVSTDWLFRFAQVLRVQPSELISDPDARRATPDDAFIWSLTEGMIRARRAVPALDNAPLAVFEAAGQLAQHLIEHGAGLRRWEDVVETCRMVAASAARIAVDCGPPAAAEPVNLVVHFAPASTDRREQGASS
jgi:transcriptional regulator with XRE-family HTH domain